MALVGGKIQIRTIYHLPLNNMISMLPQSVQPPLLTNYLTEDFLVNSLLFLQLQLLFPKFLLHFVSKSFYIIFS